MTKGLGANGSLAKGAYIAIKDAVLRCRLEPGLHVNRAQLGQQFSFGDAAIREALSRLSQEGLVEVLPREGYRIVPVSLKQVHDLFATRMIIEPAAARLAAGNVDPEEMRILQEQNRLPARWTSREELEAYVRANTAFHRTIARATGNDRLVRVMDGLLDEIERTMLLSYLISNRTARLESGHIDLVAALLENDGDRAADAMARDLADAHAFVIDGLLHSPDLQAVSFGLGAAASSS